MDFAQEEKLRIGVTDWNLNLGANPEALPLAAKLGFDAVQISFGRKLVDGKMPADNPEVIARYSAFPSNISFRLTEPASISCTTMV
jgi:predicted N-formylglutamate amidohydrolase